MPEKLTIIAKIEAKPESLNEVKSAILKLIEPTRNEKGCLQYDLHQDHEKAELFMLVENWESQVLWEAHMQSRHLQEFIKESEGLLIDLRVHQMYKVR
jgi:quinol monooxygenase YgiN